MSTPAQKPQLDGMPISDTAIRQPVLITMLILLAVVVGLMSYLTLPVSLLPDIDLPIVSIQVPYPGAGPDSVADQVARPIEDTISTISGVDRVTSTSVQGAATIVIEFVDGTNIDNALQEVREKVGMIRNRLPGDIREPVFARVDPNQNPIVTLAVSSSGQRDSLALRQLIEDEIVKSIQRAPGVGSIDVIGGDTQQVNVLLDLRRLQALRILPSQVSSAISAANTDIGLGTGRLGGQEYDLRTPSVFQSPADIATVGIGTTGYTIGDVARIEEGRADVRTLVRLDGSDAILLDIRNQSGSNVVGVADAALAEADRAFAAHPDLSYAVMRNDAVQVRANVDGAIEEILIAVVLAMLVVWLFFRDLRNTLVTVIGLPVIIIATFGMMAVFGISVNILSLLALSVSVGLVIDDAIVVRENIFRHMERGESPIVASSRATAQVSMSVLAMTLTIIVVFAPTAFTSGTTGIIFYTFGITVAAAMAISLVEAFTLAPMLSAYWFKQLPPKPLHIAPGEEHLPHEAHEELGRMERGYARLLSWTLRHRAITLGIGAAFVVLSVLAASTLKFAFLPVIDNHRLSVGIELAPGTPLEQTDSAAREVEQILRQDPAVEAVLTTVGTSGASERATFLATLHEDVPGAVVRERLRPQLAHAPGIAFGLPTVQGGDGLSVAQRPLALRIRSTGDIDELAPLAQQLIDSFQGIPGLADMGMTYVAGAPELEYRLDQQRANDYGLTNQSLAATLRALNDGDTAATYRADGQDYDIVVRLRPEDRTDVENLGSLVLPLGASNVPISSVTSVLVTTGPTAIRNVDRQTEIVIGANNVGRNINDVRADMSARMGAIELPPNVTLGFGGATESQNEGIQSLLLAAALSVLFVYMVLASQFGSFLQPLVIMLAMPLSFLGAFVGLWVAGLELDVVAMIGMLMLLGLVVKNSILLVDFTNQLRSAGMPISAALERAGAVRLRPILMTSVTILLSALPAAIGLGEGAELRRGLSTVVIGGVLTSTLLTLLLVPTAYSLLESFTAWAGARRRAPRPQPSKQKVVHSQEVVKVQVVQEPPAHADA